MEETKNAPRTLQELSPGESGMILSVGNQSGAVKRRLVDMGLTPGTVVKVTKIAPLGDPLEVSLRGYELSLRKDDAAQIQIGTPAALLPPTHQTAARTRKPSAASCGTTSTNWSTTARTTTTTPTTAAP